MKRNWLADKVVQHLSDDLRKKKYRGNPNPVAGHCYIVCEAIYHLGTGHWLPCFVTHEGEPHWYLIHKYNKKILDPTASQFQTPVPYHLGIRKGFLTKNPSKRCSELMDRVLSEGKENE